MSCTILKSTYILPINEHSHFLQIVTIVFLKTQYTKQIFLEICYKERTRVYKNTYKFCVYFLKRGGCSWTFLDCINLFKIKSFVQRYYKTSNFKAKIYGFFFFIKRHSMARKIIYVYKRKI